jgi:hypothetical protein
MRIALQVILNGEQRAKLEWAQDSGAGCAARSDCIAGRRGQVGP